MKWMLLWCGLTLGLHARIGESIEEIRKRHGNGKEIGNQVVMTIEGYDATITLEQGKSIMEIYTPHLEGGVEVRNRKMEWADIQKLLDLHSEGKSWQKLSVPDETARITWRRADGKVFVRYSEKDNNITFMPSLSGPVKPL